MISRRPPVVLIGPISNDPAESVSAVNRSFIEGLEGEVRHIASPTHRRFGNTRQSRVNPWNLYYLAKHLAIWTGKLLWHRPQVAHYSINSGWALRKGLLFLRIARLLGARTVGHLHSGSFLTFWDALPAPQRRAALREFLRLDAFVVLSDQWRDDVRDRIGVPESKIHVVNNPIDPRFEEPAMAFPEDRATRPPTILGLGIMGRDKGVLDLVAAAGAAARAGAEFRLVLAGPEREPGIRARVESEVAAQQLATRTEFHGLVRGVGKLQLFHDASIIVLPSYYENFPLVLLEAAAAGTAIITTPVGAVPEFFEDGVSALFVHPGNIDELAQTMTRLLRNHDERTSLAQSARGVFRDRLSRRSVMKAMHTVYDSVLVSGCFGSPVSKTTRAKTSGMVPPDDNRHETEAHHATGGRPDSRGHAPRV